jgi:hypothetical protein
VLIITPLLLFQQIGRAWGGLDILINNAGIDGKRAVSWDAELEAWRATPLYRHPHCSGHECSDHYWWPKISGKRYHEWTARVAALIIFIGFNLTFFPQFVLGHLGMPRRYHVYPPEFQTLNVLSTAGASIMAVGYVMPLFYLGWSFFRGRPSGPNPWGATGLEWQTPSPAPEHNFETTPIVTTGAYNYPELP